MTPRAEDIEEAVARLRRGEIVAYPTETYYGLAVDALDEAALGRLLSLKARGAEQGNSVLVSGRMMLDDLVAEVPPAAESLMAAHWPGPLTLALPARPGLPDALVRQECVALRESPHPLARALVEAFGGPLTATSANRSAEPPASTPEEVRAVFGNRCFVLDGGRTAGGAPSTLCRVTGARVEVLRAGPIAIDEHDGA